MHQLQSICIPFYLVLNSDISHFTREKVFHEITEDMSFLLTGNIKDSHEHSN